MSLVSKGKDSNPGSATHSWDLRRSPEFSELLENEDDTMHHTVYYAYRIIVSVIQSMSHRPGSGDVSFLFPNHGVISVPVHPIYSSGDLIWGSMTSIFSKFTEMEIFDFGNLV